ncbi:DUF4136 domain-containing protein [Maribacter halichondriae]|uniref:DUF4136 domain-containing protein n=1 Tax=Maribacter halichondriae TaxID=2980554 RepID=UPI002358979A|nr:DUF4136 domain-containing protein [Maribacter sp. Hal144]
MRTLFIALVYILASSCAGVKVVSVQDPKIDLNKYNTYCWIQGCELNYQGPDYGYNLERMQSIQNIIKEELESKGLVNDENTPELLVGFHVILEEKESVYTKHPDMMDPYVQPIRYWDEYESYYNQETYRFLKGSLIIDLIDSETGAVVWQSTAERYMELNEQMDKDRMIKGVKKALKEFPSKLDVK